MSLQAPTFFIGDVHGCYDQLCRLIDNIDAYAAYNGVTPNVTLLGDLVDRGPHSKKVVQLACDLTRDRPQFTTLMGNHDQTFVMALELGMKSFIGHQWLNKFGGFTTLISYGIEGEDRNPIVRIMDENPEHIAFLKGLPLTQWNGPFLAVHAGYDPRKPLDRQDEDDLMWIREEFLDFQDNTIIPAIHGHTIMKLGLPVVSENRISIDTGCFKTGVLTSCLVEPDNGDIRFFQTLPGAVLEVEPALLDRGYGTIYDRFPRLLSKTFELKR